jgi:hypothetical protein
MSCWGLRSFLDVTIFRHSEKQNVTEIGYFRPQIITCTCTYSVVPIRKSESQSCVKEAKICLPPLLVHPEDWGTAFFRNIATCTRLHIATSQQIIFFIVTAARISSPTNILFFWWVLILIANCCRGNSSKCITSWNDGPIYSCSVKNYRYTRCFKMIVTTLRAYIILWSAHGSAVVKALCYKPEGGGFDTRWGEWIFSFYLILPSALGPGVYSTSNRNEHQKQKNNVSGK